MVKRQTQSRYTHRKSGEAATDASSSVQIFLVPLPRGNTGINQKQFRTQKSCLYLTNKKEIHSLYQTNLTFWAKPIPLWFRCQFQTLSMINPRTEFTAEDLAFPMTNPAIEIIPSILRYNINRVCGEWLLHIVKRTMS